MHSTPASWAVIAFSQWITLCVLMLNVSNGIYGFIRACYISYHCRFPIAFFFYFCKFSSGLDQSISCLRFEPAGKDGHNRPVQESAIQIDRRSDFIIFLNAHDHRIIDANFIQFCFAVARAYHLFCLSYNLSLFINHCVTAIFVRSAELLVLQKIRKSSAYLTMNISFKPVFFIA